MVIEGKMLKIWRKKYRKCQNLYKLQVWLHTDFEPETLNLTWFKNSKRIKTETQSTCFLKFTVTNPTKIQHKFRVIFPNWSPETLPIHFYFTFLFHLPTVCRLFLNYLNYFKTVFFLSSTCTFYRHRNGNICFSKKWHWNVRVMTSLKEKKTSV